MVEVTNQQSTMLTDCSPTKAEGAFIALAAGDALGWPQEFPSKTLGRRASPLASPEFRAWARRGGGRFYPYEEIVQPGEYSDDTQLTLAVARCRMFTSNSWWNAFTRTELPLWALYERGGGRATKRAADLWTKGTPPWKDSDERTRKEYFKAGGNGVTMRILPHAIFYACHNEASDLIRDVVKDGVATHGHPRALVGAMAYAYAAWWLLRSVHTIRFGELVEVLLDNVSVWGTLPASGHAKNGWLEAAERDTKGGYEAIWRGVVDEMRVLLKQARRGLEAGAIANDEKILRDLGCFGQVKGAGTVSSAASVYLCARYAVQPVQAVLKAAFVKGADTDTVAAMTGGLMGCLAGSDWLPREWFAIQDCDYLRQLANKVARGPIDVQDRPANLRTISKKDLDAFRSALLEGHEGDLDLDGNRRARVAESVVPKSLSKSTVAQIWRLQTVDGQTIYITKLGRRSGDIAEAREPKQTPDSGIAQAPGNANAATAAGVKVSVDDIRLMIDFYEKVLGLSPVIRGDQFVSYGCMSLVDAGYANKISGGAVDPSTGPGRNRIEIHVSGLEEVYQRVQSRNPAVRQGITTMPWGDKSFHCLDPEGNIVEVIERQ